MNDKPMENVSREEFYNRLREELNNNTDWPVRYMYKFIIPNDERKIEDVERAFDGKDAEKRRSFSKNGKYVSLTFVVEEADVESILNQYRKMENIEGLIAL